MEGGVILRYVEGGGGYYGMWRVEVDIEGGMLPGGDLRVGEGILRVVCGGGGGY